MGCWLGWGCDLEIPTVTLLLSWMLFDAVVAVERIFFFFAAVTGVCITQLISMCVDGRGSGVDGLRDCCAPAQPVFHVQV
jgi:hypothetical protein